MLIVLGLLVQQLVTLLLAVLITIILSLPLTRCGTVLARHGVPRAGGALIGLVLGIAAVGALLALLVPTLVSQVGTLITAAPGLVHVIEIKASHLTGARPGHVASQLQQYAATYAADPARLLGPVASIGVGAATVVGGLVIAIITAYYIAARPQPLVDAALRMFAPRRRPEVMRVLLRLRAAWLGWLRGLVIAMAIVGVLLYLALQLLVGLQFALFFAVFSALAEVVPYFGALLSGIPPVAFALTISPGTAIAVLVIYIAVHQIEANFIGPIVMSRAVHLHPAVIAFGVVAVGEVFGFLGLVLAVPILSMVVILIEEVWVRPHERPHA
ncbi:MAG: AI-2E family transporter [Solirubrobacteraceae bacterium]